MNFCLISYSLLYVDSLSIFIKRTIKIFKRFLYDFEIILKIGSIILLQLSSKYLQRNQSKFVF